MKKMTDVNLIVGVETADDAAVYKINDTTAAIQTLDFFTPIVDDPYTFGRIAAANSLSDVYAMGGDPITAMNIVCFPEKLDPAILGEILKGGQDKMIEAGCLLVGGHTVQDDEPKYGLSVLGLVHPEEVWKNSTSQPGDILVLTKPVGTGIMSTALKGEVIEADDPAMKESIDCMQTLNKRAKEKAEKYTIHACTDITGFGLLGHMEEMATGAGVSMELFADQVPLISKSYEFANMGMVPKGAYDNRRHTEGKIDYTNIDQTLVDLFFDPQTSGGLLLAMPEEDATQYVSDMACGPFPAAIVGRVIEKEETLISVK